MEKIQNDMLKEIPQTIPPKSELWARLKTHTLAVVAYLIISESSLSIWMNFGILLRFERMMNVILTSSHPISILKREPHACDFIPKI